MLSKLILTSQQIYKEGIFAYRRYILGTISIIFYDRNCEVTQGEMG